MKQAQVLTAIYNPRLSPRLQLEMAERKEVGARRGALRNGRFPVQALVMIDENARGGAVNRLNMKRYVVKPKPYHDRVAELCSQLQIPKACGKAGIC